MSIIFETIFGSNLYGTTTLTSDIDYKIIYAPSKKDLILGKIKLFSSINTTNKIDIHTKSDNNIIESEYFTLHKFLDHLYKGQIWAIDILYSPEQFWYTEPSEFWVNKIIPNREKFISKKLIRFVEYAHKQAAKYGIKGSRINSVNNYLTLFKNVDSDTKINSLLSEINSLIDNHSKIELSKDYHDSYLVICGKKFSFNTKVKYILPPLEKYIKDFGERARKAAYNKGIDWKAISHAVRAAREVKELITTKNLNFPLSYADDLIKIKNGDLQFQYVEEYLMELIEEVSEIIRNSNIPDNPDINIDNLILDYYGY